MEETRAARHAQQAARCEIDAAAAASHAGEHEREALRPPSSGQPMRRVW